MKTSSAKAKGRRLQNNVRKLLLETLELENEEHIDTATMGESGEDIKLSPTARKKFPFSVECKNQERLNIWSALEQSEQNAKKYHPIVVFKRNYSKTYIAMELEHFLDVIKENNQLKEHVKELKGE